MNFDSVSDRRPPLDKDPRLDRLASLLTLDTPVSPEENPPVFTFQRQREIELDWKKIYEGSQVTTNASSARALREYFESSWGWPKAGKPTKNDLSNLLFPKSEPDWAIKEVGYAGQDKTLAEAHPVFRTAFPPTQAKPVGTAVSKGLVFRHRQSGRRYLAIAAAGQELSIDELREPETYDAAWRSKIAGVEIVYETKEDAENFQVQFSEIDLRPGIIARRYSELKGMLDLAKSVSDALPPIGADKVKALFDAGKDVEEIAKLQQKYARIKRDVANIEREIERLASIAEGMGLILGTKKRDIFGPDGKTRIRTLEEGAIYRPYRHSVTWTTTHTRRELRWAFLFAYHVTVTVPEQHVEVITDYEPVDTSGDLLTLWREDHMKRNPQHEVIVLQQAGKRFVAPDGSPLRAIMARCDLDESFRRRCVVLLPVFEESLTGQRVLAKYHVFQHPLPGITPAIMPRLTLEESLSYRTVWNGSVLGELVNTINLAPGEQRTIHVRKAYKREATVSRTAVSVFDVNRAESADLATEMERISRQERERSANLQTETSASGGAFGVTASASVKAGVSTSAKEFGQSMAKVAKNAATSITEQNREEVTTSSTVQTTVETTEETTAEIRNINQGRTLNLMFYRLYNRYIGGLYMEGLQFNLIPSVETIAGSGVFEAQTYSAAEIGKALDELQRNPLLLDLDAEGELRLREIVLKQLFELIDSEYAEHREGPVELMLGGESGEPMARNRRAKAARRLEPRPRLTRSINVLPVQEAYRAVSFAAGAGLEDSPPKTRVEDVQTKLDELLRTSVAALKTKQQIEPVNLLVGSGGLYLDATVGALPSTEPYSEEMRTREIRMRDAEIFATRSKGILQQAQAGHLNGGTFLTSIHPDVETLDRLTVGLNTFIEPGEWQLHVDGELKGKVSEDQPVNTIGFTWKGEQAWLRRPDLKEHVELYNPGSGKAIRFTVVEAAADAARP